MKAYPNLQLTVSEMGQVRSINEVEDGMDLRDYFAAKVVQYWLSNPIDNRQIEKLCEGAYQIADAMMKARDK
jgi:hypothetical protein